MDPALKLDRLAQLRAEIEAGASPDEVLQREKLTIDSWREVGTFWDAKMADEASQNRFVLTNRYNTAFNTKRRLLASKRKSVEPVETEDERTQVAPSAPAVAPPVTAPVAQIPAAAVPPPAPAVMMSPPPASSLPAPRWQAPPLPNLPPRPAPQGVALPLSPPPPPHQAFSFSEETHAFSGTMVADENLAAAIAAAMPFRSAAPMRQPSASDHGGTVELDENLFAGSEILPFLKAARAAQAAGLPIPFPKTADPSPSAHDYGSTLTLDPLSSDLGAAVPFLKAMRGQQQARESPKAAAPQPAPLKHRYTIEQFAALTAQVAAAPHDIALIRHRWKLDEAGHRAESEAWQTECELNPALLSRYAELVKHFRAAYAAGAKK